MKIVYVLPYEGEAEIVSAGVSEGEVLVVDDVSYVEQSVRSEVEILSVFVDYQVTAEVLDIFPNLKMISTRSVGYDHIDMAAATKRGITLCRVPHYGTRTVAEYAIALIFALSRNAFRAYTDMQSNAGITNFENYEGFDLCGKTLGVVGTGAIGHNVCLIARGLGLEVLAYDVSPNEAFAKENDFRYTTLEETLKATDIVTLHVPLIPPTKHLINEEKLRLMKPGSYLINTARGEIVDTKALVKVLEEGHLAGAGLDVLEGERELREEAELLSTNGPDAKVDAETWQTLVVDHTLINMPNVIVTPHIAFNTVEAKREITDTTLANINKFIAGEPQNIVTDK